MTPAEFAQQQGVSERTVQRWAQDGEIPGAEQRQQGSRIVWWLPADAMHIVPLIDIPAPSRRDTPPGDADATPTRRDVAPVSADLALPLQGLSLADALARQPAFLDLQTAAQFLGVPVATIKRNPQDFDARRYDDYRRWMVPQAAVRRYAGL